MFFFKSSKKSADEEVLDENDLSQENPEEKNVQDEEQESDETRIANEYKEWRETSKFIYSNLSESVLDWPSLTFEFLPKSSHLPATPVGGKLEVLTVDMILGTYTSDEQQNYLMLGSAQFSKTKKVKSTITINRKLKHIGEVNKARAMPQNNNIIATASAHGTVYIYDTSKDTDTFVNKLVEHTENGYGLSWNMHTPGSLLSCVENGQLALWDTEKATLVYQTTKKTGLNDIAWKNATIFGYAGEDGSFGLDDSRSQQTTATKLLAHTDPINALAFSYASEYIVATASADTTIGLWDLRNLDSRLHTFSGHSGAVTSLKWSPHDERVLASGSDDRKIILWDISKIGGELNPDESEDGGPEIMFRHSGHTNAVSDFAFNDEHPWMLGSVSDDNICQIWETKIEAIGRGSTQVNASVLE